MGCSLTKGNKTLVTAADELAGISSPGGGGGDSDGSGGRGGGKEELTGGRGGSSSVPGYKRITIDIILA